MIFLLGVLVLFSALVVGIPVFHQTLFPLICVLPQLKKPRNLKRFEVFLVFVPLLWPPLKWLSVLAVTTILAMKVLPAGYPLIYFSGLLIALTTVLIELPYGSLVKEMLGHDLMEEISFEQKKGKHEKYPSYSSLQMNTIEWKVNNVNLLPYRDLVWECSECYLWNKFKEDGIFLKGSGRRFVVQCSDCGKHSIVRVSGVLHCRLLTEARLPDYSKKLHAEESRKIVSSG